MLVTINSKIQIPFFSIGENSAGIRVVIVNGDLKKAPKLEVMVLEEKPNYISAEIQETFGNEEFIATFSDDDFLFSTEEIEELPLLSTYLIKDKWVFLHKRLFPVVEYLKQYPELWANAKLRFVHSRSITAGIIIFGLPFQKALAQLQKRKLERARLYCPNKNPFSTLGGVADMLANIYEDKDGAQTVEIWQGIENEPKVFYSHGIIDPQTGNFTHFDCALIDMYINDREALFRDSRKMKGSGYQKLFRIDGTIQPAHIFELAHLFFPLSNLTDEFFEIERIE